MYMCYRCSTKKSCIFFVVWKVWAGAGRLADYVVGYEQYQKLVFLNIAVLLLRNVKKNDAAGT